MRCMSTAPRVVVITGVSSGVGRATAREFARIGATVALLARGERGLEACLAAPRQLDRSHYSEALSSASIRAVLQDSASQARASTEPGALLAQVANAIVRIHKRFYGKGPVKARAHLSEDLLTVRLEGGLTRAEQTLQHSGRTAEVVNARLAIAETIAAEYRAAVETAFYRSVRSYMTALDTAEDLQMEIFVLESHRKSEPIYEHEPQSLRGRRTAP
jgi:uncharacterized protein YbcI